MQTNNTPVLCWNHPKFCTMAVSRWRGSFELWLSGTTRLGFYQRLLEASSGQENALPKGPNPCASGKKQLGSPFPQNMKPAYAFLPLTQWCWLCEPTNIGRVVGVFLYLKVCMRLPSCSGFAFALWRMGHGPILVARQRLLNTWGGEMSRKMPGDKHPPFCPLLPDILAQSVLPELSLMGQCSQVSVLMPRGRNAGSHRCQQPHFLR